jgi:hypothetical protein
MVVQVVAVVQVMVTQAVLVVLADQDQPQTELLVLQDYLLTVLDGQLVVLAVLHQ